MADGVGAYRYLCCERGSGSISAAEECRTLLTTALGCYARDAVANILTSTRVSFDALRGAFTTVPSDPRAVVDTPIVVPDIVTLFQSRLKHEDGETIRSHVEAVIASAEVAGQPLDAAAVLMAQENIRDLRELLCHREVREVYLRAGASDDEVHAVLLELGVIRPPAPVSAQLTAQVPARKTRRRALA